MTKITNIFSDRVFIYKSLVVINIALVVLVILKIILGINSVFGIKSSSEKTIAYSNHQQDDAEKYLEVYKSGLAKLKEKGVFYIPKPKPAPPQVTGILGEMALVNNNWCKVGDKPGGAEIIKIEPTVVTILWEGKELELAPMLAATKYDASPQKVKVVKVEEKHEAASVAKVPEDETPKVIGEDPLAWMGVELTAQMREFLTKLFSYLSDDQMKEMKNEWNSMSADRKQMQLDQLQKALDSGQADMILEQAKNGNL